MPLEAPVAHDSFKMKHFFLHLLSRIAPIHYYKNHVLRGNRTTSEFKIIFFKHTLALDTSWMRQHNIHALLHSFCIHLTESSRNIKSLPEKQGPNSNPGCDITHKPRSIVTMETPIATSLTHQGLW